MPFWKVKNKIGIKKFISSILPPRSKNCNRILLYHSIGELLENDRFGLRTSKEHFKEQMKFLFEDNYEVVSLSELFNKSKNEDYNENKRVVVTFDDGYKDNLLNAVPILNEYNLKYTLFVSPFFLDNSFSKQGYVNDWKYLDWEDLEYLINNGAEIGCHSRYHEDLTTLSEQRLKDNISTAKEILEKRTGQDIQAFSYPYGKFSDRVKEVVSNSGFRMACCSIGGSNTSSTDVFELRRTEISKYDSLRDFKKKLKGRHDWLAWFQMKKFKVHA
tara:strand:+ start:3280 stop:4098 length:819 start_codon:yes stop_codon:yes gene_type:complete